MPQHLAKSKASLSSWDISKALFHWILCTSIPEVWWKKGNTREDVVCLFDPMGAYCNNQNLYVHEFSKSLMDHAYNQHVNSKPGFVHDRKHHVSLFNTKFFCADAKLTLVQLGRTHQYPKYGRIHEAFPWESPRLLQSSSWGCPVDVCSHSIIEEYSIYLENLSFPSFSWFTRLRGGQEIVTRTVTSSEATRASLKRRHMVIVVGKSGGV